MKIIKYTLKLSRCIYLFNNLFVFLCSLIGLKVRLSDNQVLLTFPSYLTSQLQMQLSKSIIYMGARGFKCEIYSVDVNKYVFIFEYQHGRNQGRVQ